MASLLPYLKRLEITGVEESDTPTTVNNYLPIKELVEVVDQEGNPWEPVPGPDPWDDLVITSGANLIAENVYEIGQAVNAKTAIFTGGNPETTAYRSRWQSRRTSSDAWENSNWMNTTNGKNDHSYFIGKPGQIRFQSQARDTSDDPVTQVNSFTSVKEVPFTEIGSVTATIDGAPYDITVGAPVTILSGDSVVLATSISGDASPSYTWTVKSGSASLTGTGSTVTAFIDTVAPGSVQIQCDIIDTNASDNPFSFRYAFLIGE
jgi:hypothetical protein